MQTLQEYKCPCCGGAIAFDSGIQKMKCPYCDTEFDMETLASYDDGLNGKQDNMNWETSAGGEWQEGETDGLRSYVCKSCGGEIVGDENTAATACPFCGNPVVMMGQLSGELKPDFVIPFKLDKKAAKAGSVPVTICGLAVGNPVNTVQYLQMGLRSFSVSPQNLLSTKKALLEADAHPDDTELE